MTYPMQPGWRQGATETSKEAALALREKAPALVDRLEAMIRVKPASPEQLCERLADQGERLLLTSIRARVCQLHKQGRVVDSGARGLGESRRAKVIVWRVATPEERTAFAAALEGDEQHG